MTTPTIDLNELERLHSNATQGEWRAGLRDAEAIRVAGTTYHNEIYSGAEDTFPYIGFVKCDREEDAALLAAAVNALPALLRMARENAELHRRLRDFTGGTL